MALPAVHTQEEMRHLILGGILVLAMAACTRRDAGLREYHEALRLADDGDSPAALTMLEQAAGLAVTDSLRALIWSQKGTLFFNQHLLDRSLQCYRQAYLIDARAADTMGLAYDLRDMGNVYRATGNDDSCLACFGEARQLAVMARLPRMQHDVESQMAAWHLRHGHTDEARRLLMPALAYADSSNRSALTYMLADLYHQCHETESATYYYNKVLDFGSLYARRSAHRMLAHYALQEGRTADAATHLHHYEELSDTALQTNDAEALRRMTALYDYSQHQHENDLLMQRLVVAVAVAVALMALLTAAMLYFSRRRLYYRLKVQQLETLLEEYRRNTPDERLRRQSSLDTTPVCLRIHQLLADNHCPPMNDADFRLLEDTFRSELPAFLPKLQDFCRLTPQEQRVCMLLRLGIGPSDIGRLTAHSRQSVSNTRSRLFEKAFGKKGAATEWDEFVMSL